MAIQNRSGETLTCSNADCPCELQIVTPCPHGDQYACACGHPLTSASSGAGAGESTGEQGIGARAEAAGIVDQQAAVLDELPDQQQ